MALGAILGGVAGGIAGLLGGRRNVPLAQGVDINPNAFKIPDADLYRQRSKGYEQEAAGQTQALRPKQAQFLETLQQQMEGKGPSLATELLKSAQTRNLAQQVAAAQATRGNSALLQRELLKRQQEGAANVANQASIARVQEQLGAQQQYGTELGKQAEAAQVLTQKYLSLGFDMASAQQKAAAELEQLRVQQALGLAGVNAQIGQANAGNNPFANFLQGAGAGIAGGMALFPGSSSTPSTSLDLGKSVISSGTSVNTNPFLQYLGSSQRTA